MRPASMDIDASRYASIFKNSRIETVTRYSDAGPGPKGSAMTVVIELEGLKFIGLNAGPHFKFTEVLSRKSTSSGRSSQRVEKNRDAAG